MTELEALKERIRILEQRSRRLRNVGIGLALFVIASFAVAQQRQATPQLRIPDVIEAKKFVLRDDKGAIRAELALNIFGDVGPSLWFYAPKLNDQGPLNPLAGLGAGTDAGYLHLSQGKSDALFGSGHIWLLQDGKPRVVLGSRDGDHTMPLAAIAAMSKTAPAPLSSLLLLDKDGKVLFRAP
jgi:hypothetical protein